RGIVAPRAVSIQFRYGFVADRNGLQVVRLDDLRNLERVASVSITDARDVYVARTYAYVAGGSEGLFVVDVEKPEAPGKPKQFNDGGRISDLQQVRVGMAYDSAYALLADGKNGLHVVQLVTPEDGGRSAYGWAPEPRPKRIATFAGGPVV